MKSAMLANRFMQTLAPHLRLCKSSSWEGVGYVNMCFHLWFLITYLSPQNKTTTIHMGDFYERLQRRYRTLQVRTVVKVRSRRSA